ncbi:MAG TPA: hypothetical protein VMS77_03535 [Conexivisphaerales archaeon]|nr:hypothetical protein [Conexivisphaerales archaeon]
MRTALAAVALVLLVIAVGAFAMLLAPPAAFPIPQANITVGPAAGPSYQQLTSGGWDDISPEWSPDGSRITYLSDRGGLWSVWVMEANGSRQTKLTPAATYLAYPVWSPDSSRIAFWEETPPTSSLVVVNATTGSVLAASPRSDDVASAAPVWSPDGSLLLYYRMTPSVELACLDPATGSVRPLTAVNGTDATASWAGVDRVVFSSLDGGHYTIRWLNMTSGEEGVLTNATYDSRGGAISPDGTKIAYYSDVFLVRSYYNLYDISGYNVWESSLHITQYDIWANGLSSYNSSYLYGPGGEANQYRPGSVMTAEALRWSSDGKYIACVLDNAVSGPRVYLWTVGTSSVLMAGPFTGVAYHPSWQPNSTIVAFDCNASGSFHIWTSSMAGSHAVVSGY